MRIKANRSFQMSNRDKTKNFSMKKGEEKELSLEERKEFGSKLEEIRKKGWVEEAKASSKPSPQKAEEPKAEAKPAEKPSPKPAAEAKPAKKPSPKPEAEAKPAKDKKDSNNS